MCAKKMILVDPLKWENRPVSTQPITDGLATSLTYLDQDMKDILSNNDIDDYSKAQAYQQILQRYMLQSEKYRNKPIGRIENVSDTKPLNSTDNNSSNLKSDTTDVYKQEQSDFESRVLKTVPRYLKPKASLLINYLKDIPNITWDSKDQLINDSRTIEGSNGVDLINDLLRDRKTLKPPQGWDILASALKKSNVPKEIIGNSSRWSWIQDRGRPVKRISQRSKPSLKEKWEELS